MMLLSEERGVSRHSGLIVKYSLLSTDVEVSRAGSWKAGVHILTLVCSEKLAEGY